MVVCYSEFSHSVIRGDIWMKENGMIKDHKTTISLPEALLRHMPECCPTRLWLQLKMNFNEKNYYLFTS